MAVDQLWTGWRLSRGSHALTYFNLNTRLQNLQLARGGERDVSVVPVLALIDIYITRSKFEVVYPTQSQFKSSLTLSPVVSRRQLRALFIFLPKHIFAKSKIVVYVYG